MVLDLTIWGTRVHRIDIDGGELAVDLIVSTALCVSRTAIVIEACYKTCFGDRYEATLAMPRSLNPWGA
jgi:hypothetical protein